MQSMRTRAAAAQGGDPELRFFFGASHQIGPALGLDNDWAARLIAATGDYGEIYERDLGSGSPLQLPRGENNLRLRGGAITALPFK
jgi:general L-amino acid transport system substrate-binding protein